jgi:hypothetical protein
MTSQHTHSPGDFCFIRSDELRGALGTAYATSEKHNLWWILRQNGPEFFLAHLIPSDPVSDAFRSLAYHYMTRIAAHGWDAFVAYYEAEMRKPREPCLLDRIGAGKYLATK